MAKYFGCHYGSINNIGWLQAKGFNEVGYVIPWGAAIPSPGDILNRGMKATLNCINGGEGQGPTNMFVDGGQFEWYFNAVKAAGWNMIAGEGCTTSVINSAQKYLPYVNYGGDQANNMYASPWGHPNTGYGHLDYIETYGRNTCSFDWNGVVGCINAAKAAGAKHLGILIGDWCLGVSPQTYISLVDTTGCDSICFWGGYGQPSSRMQGLADVLIGHYGAAKWGAGPTPTPTPGPGPTPTPIPPDAGPGNAATMHGFSDINILPYLAKNHNGQPTSGYHTVQVYLPDAGAKVTMNAAITTREYQPGRE